MASVLPGPGPVSRRSALIGVAVAVAIALVVLSWAKWFPYAQRIVTLSGTGTWTGTDVLGAGGVRPGDPPSLRAATSFTGAYLSAVWQALLAALLISAAIQALVPRTWLLRVLDRPGRLRSAAAGGLVSTPSMMCTCCTAPVAVTLRRQGVPTSAVVAYWLGNPLLNPAVLVFLALVAPWEWTVTRLVVALLVVVGGAALVARLTDRPELPGPEVAPGPDDGGLAGAPRRFLRALLRLSIVLVPEYLVVVLLLGAFRGWLLPVGALSAGIVAVLVAAVVGTLLVIPTAGEIPILQGLALAGAAAGPVGALLVTLPAVSIPGIVMVGRALGWRATAATTALVVAGGLAGAGLLTVL
ncbi:hypothetical protein EV383_4168 [Pseudonocardia sediminis]|uniref:Permease n=1 Tax=Pseudonocardia sediminis TaxID=1397368 RepID=A0A4Q7V1F5_PSEST|nr:permease [Pseudonocardia sediminis]RZT87258.1 hypothetical protein EV383_4168 [Pseudonocardia sediminis]